MSKAERNSLAQELDALVPLDGASHEDVIDYRVTVPLRYAAVQARLRNGRTACLANSRQFLGWIGYGRNPTLLFGCGNRQIVVHTGSEPKAPPKTFIAPDGAQLSFSSAV